MSDHQHDATETHRARRRRLLATLGAGLAGAYVAPTLFSVGQAQAWDGRRSRPSRSRPSWSRPSWSRPSRDDRSYRRNARQQRRDEHYHSRRDYRRERSRLRDYREDPLHIVEDVLFGRPDGRW